MCSPSLKKKGNTSHKASLLLVVRSSTVFGDKGATINYSTLGIDDDTWRVMRSLWGVALHDGSQMLQQAGMHAEVVEGKGVGAHDGGYVDC